MAANIATSDSDSEGSFYGFTHSDFEDFELTDTDDSDDSISDADDDDFSESDDGNLADIRRKSWRWTAVQNLGEDMFDQTQTGVTDYLETIGPKDIPDTVRTPVDYVSLLFGEDYFTELVFEINSYGDKKAAEKLTAGSVKNKSRFKKWRHTHLQELKAFLGLIINMGLIQKKRLNEYWSTQLSQQTPYFATVMTRDRFVMLMSMFHTKPAAINLPGRAHKVSAFIQHFVSNFRKFYTPAKELSVDESLVGFQGKAQALQYMPNKHHHKFGIKLWNLCESQSGYTLNVEMYSGKPTNASENGLAYDVCMAMMAPYKNLGHHLYVDNFFSGIMLAQDLLKEHTYLTGTLRANRRGIPPQVKVPQKKGDITAMRKGPLLCVNFHDKKPVMFLTTNDTAVPITYLSKRNRERRVPTVTCNYNKYMGGVDMSDMRTYMFLDERRSIKWTNKVFFFMFGRLALNAFILYSQHVSPVPPEQLLDRRRFLVQVVEGLVGEYREVRRVGRPLLAVEDRLINPAKHLKAHKLPTGKLRNCIVCSDHKAKKRVRTSYECLTCDVGLCPGTCWFSYHTTKVYKPHASES